SNNVQVRQTDVAGNISNVGSLTFTLDTTIAAPGIALTSDTGSSASDHITKTGTISLSGIEAGATVEYSTDNGGTWNSSFAASEGSNNVQVRQTDVAGNSSVGSLSFTLDTLAPAAPGIALTSDTGSSTGDHITKTGTLSLSGIEAGATVEYSTDGGSHWISSFAAVQGNNNVQVRQTDVAGNTGSVGSLTFTLDTTVAAPGVALTSDTGSSTSDHITKTGTISLSGIETGAIVEYSTDNGGTWNSSFAASEGSNNVQVRQTDVAGNSSVGSLTFTLDTIAPAAPTVDLTSDTGSSPSDHISKTGTISLTGIEVGASVEYSTDSGATWSSSFTAAEGNNNVQVRQTDVAGNTGNSSLFSFTYDTIAPVPSITLAPITGDNIINIPESLGDVAVTGLAGGDAKAGDSVTLSVNNHIYTGAVNADGTTFSALVAGSDLVADVDKTIDASISTTDFAGNVGTSSSSIGYSLNNTLIGTSGDDTLTGNSAANTLVGGLGNDTLEGMGGADSLQGIVGNDTASYAHAASGVTASLTIGLVTQTGDAAG